METVDIVGIEAPRTEDSLSSQQESAAPVVYQLVRVDGDGRLVPATDEEVMAVEDLIEDDKSDATIITDTGQTLEGFDKIQFDSSEGLQELDCVDTEAEKPSLPSNPQVGSGTIDVKLEERIPSLVPTASDGSCGQSGSREGCSKHSGGLDEIGSSNSIIRTSLKPDFSLLKGDIRLDDMSVKELQETFWATFGRETSVKDKQWLKRRIIMGLTNSCDFSTTSFLIVDDKVVKNEPGETSESVEDGVLFDCVVESASESLERSSTFHDKHNEICSSANETKILRSDNCGNKDAGVEQKPVKRVRKPTKRYIEELSEEESKESGAKIVSSVQQPGYDQTRANVSAKPCENFGLDGRCLTRMDSLGGSGVQVPYVSRIRRSRPRENFMNFMKLQPSGLVMSTRPLKNNAAPSERLDSGSGNKIVKASLSSRWIQELPVASSGRCKQYAENKRTRMEEEMELENMESWKNDSDDEVVTVPTTNGGMRRKHHRPWSLTEVVKLVEGVAKYGAGRWSEIKRVAFASYSYRTSVDLKDKWRNLLKASLSELPNRNGAHCSRKPGTVPIPAPILSRVRELAHNQSHVPLRLSSSKVAGCTDSTRSVHETRSGFL